MIVNLSIKHYKIHIARYKMLPQNKLNHNKSCLKDLIGIIFFNIL